MIGCDVKVELCKLVMQEGEQVMCMAISYASWFSSKVSRF